ncbi:hypothetical protein EYF80_045544 [Liparis tanakae]|uniref:Uncharacterized protein n=1 Tax=Liparis tanakae TaxID=230148 RepID=A0A4Z2FTC2_9TELE|nr:hypothetical protein EYF80_045544 [Liparis tanakae]
MGLVGGGLGVGGGGTHWYLLEGLLPGVRADVVVERRGSGERSAAVATLKGPVAGVRHHVVPQVRRLGEGLGAVATLVRMN